MKTSEVIINLIENISKYGDKNLKVDLLTENQSNIVKITGIYFNEEKNIFTIDCDIDDVNLFKKNIK